MLKSACPLPMLESIQFHLQSEEAVGEERERDLDSLGGGKYFRGLNSIGEGNLLRAIYRGMSLS